MVGREFLRRTKLAFDREGIRFRSRTIVMQAGGGLARCSEPISDDPAGAQEREDRLVEIKSTAADGCGGMKGCALCMSVLPRMAKPPLRQVSDGHSPCEGLAVSEGWCRARHR